MIILRTHPDHMQKVVELSKHALDSVPRKIIPGDLILISQTIAQTRDGHAPIRYVMEFVRFEHDDAAIKSLKVWGKAWRHLLIGKDCRELPHPFNLSDIQVSSRNYKQGGPYVYVAPEDEAIIHSKGLIV